MMDANQLDQLHCITFAVRSFLFHPSPIGSVSWQWGRVFVILVSELPVSIIISVKGVVPIEVSSCAN